MCSVSSSPQSSTEGFWEDPPERRSFPTSAIRFEANLPREAIQTRQTRPVVESYASRTTCSTYVPQRRQIERGIWSDGRDIVLSSDCPDVRRYLAQARDAMYLPPAPSEEVFVLAALEVFYAPTNPVHWMFWNDEKKGETADVVTRIVLHPRQRIQSSVKWNGSPEYLSILRNLHHSPAWREMFEHKHWFSILAPTKIKSPIRGPTLRRRKPGQLELRGLSASHLEGGDEEDVIEPPPKKPRTKRLATRNGSNGQPNESDIKAPKLEMVENVSASPPASCRPRLISSSFDQPIITESENYASQSCHVTVRLRKSLPRRASARKKQAKDAQESVLTLTPSRSAGQSLPPPSMSSHSRSRSVSQASAETLVTSRPRSLSGLSAATVVEIVNAMKRKATVKVDGVEIEAENKLKVVETTPNFQMVTRASARAAAGATAKPDSAPEKREQVGPPRVAESRSQVTSGSGRGEITITIAKRTRKRGKKGNR